MAVRVMYAGYRNEIPTVCIHAANMNFTEFNIRNTLNGSSLREAHINVSNIVKDNT